MTSAGWWSLQNNIIDKHLKKWTHLDKTKPQRRRLIGTRNTIIFIKGVLLQSLWIKVIVTSRIAWGQLKNKSRLADRLSQVPEYNFKPQVQFIIFYINPSLLKSPLNLIYNSLLVMAILWNKMFWWNKKHNLISFLCEIYGVMMHIATK